MSTSARKQVGKKRLHGSDLPLYMYKPTRGRYGSCEVYVKFPTVARVEGRRVYFRTLKEAKESKEYAEALDAHDQKMKRRQERQLAPSKQNGPREMVLRSCEERKECEDEFDRRFATGERLPAGIVFKRNHTNYSISCQTRFGLVRLTSLSWDDAIEVFTKHRRVAGEGSRLNGKRTQQEVAEIVKHAEEIQARGERLPKGLKWIGAGHSRPNHWKTFLYANGIGFAICYHGRYEAALELLEKIEEHNRQNPEASSSSSTGEADDEAEDEADGAEIEMEVEEHDDEEEAHLPDPVSGAVEDVKPTDLQQKLEALSRVRHLLPTELFDERCEAILSAGGL